MKLDAPLLAAFPQLTLVRAIGGAVAGLALVAVVAWFVTEPARQHRIAAAAKVDAAIASGQAAAGRDAMTIMQSADQRDAQIDQTTRSNHDAILAAPGASNPVDPGLDAAGLRALCLRRAYSADPACKRLLKPGP